ncbi:hypothetical protein [Listeria sp. ILCC797]|uniref:hypothetical protein n=1 Tax=Listeria sp. ILCC797 TaxID=1918333 RepID=UPI001C6FCA52|nr:hypothetical protein [Listeria sp. ILCC797]
MARKDYRELSGNKYSLRAKSYHMIRRVDFISNHLGALGDLLVTTMIGFILAILTLAGAAGLIVYAIFGEQGHTAVANIIPSLMIAIGGVLVALNVLLTNPSQGLQFSVSMRFLRKKISSKSISGVTVQYNPFRFAEGIDSKSILEMEVNGKIKYLAMYRVRGTISPVCFDVELNELAGLNSRLLHAMERDTVLTTINTVNASKVEKRNLPENATESMKRKRDINYEVTSQLKYNQQLSTLVIISTDTLDVMRSRIESFEIICRQGIVVGRLRLEGEELKSAVQEIYS